MKNLCACVSGFRLRHSFVIRHLSFVQSSLACRAEASAKAGHSILPSTLLGLETQLVTLGLELAFKFCELGRIEPIKQIPHAITRKIFVNLANQSVGLRRENRKLVITDIVNRMIARFSVHIDKVFMSILRSHEDERTAATPHSIRNETLTVAMTLICPIESVPSLSAEPPPAF